jgi:hypothetical protein
MSSEQLSSRSQYDVTALAKNLLSILYKFLCLLLITDPFVKRLLSTWSINKVRELIAVKVLHSSLLNITVVAFKVLPFGSYAPMSVPSPLFKTILELVLWNGLHSYIVLLLMSSSSECLPFNISFIFGNRKKSLGARSGE